VMLGQGKSDHPPRPDVQHRGQVQLALRNAETTWRDALRT
jgi:hypothetical protein